MASIEQLSFFDTIPENDPLKLSKTLSKNDGTGKKLNIDNTLPEKFWTYYENLICTLNISSQYKALLIPAKNPEVITSTIIDFAKSLQVLKHNQKLFGRTMIEQLVSLKMDDLNEIIFYLTSNVEKLMQNEKDKSIDEKNKEMKSKYLFLEKIAKVNDFIKKSGIRIKEYITISMTTSQNLSNGFDYQEFTFELINPEVDKYLPIKLNSGKYVFIIINPFGFQDKKVKQILDNIARHPDNYKYHSQSGIYNVESPANIRIILFNEEEKHAEVLKSLGSKIKYLPKSNLNSVLQTLKN